MLFDYYVYARVDMRLSNLHISQTDWFVIYQSVVSEDKDV